MAVSEAEAAICGLSGALEWLVGRLLLGEDCFGEPFQIALRRSSFFEKKGIPTPAGVVFDLPSDRGRLASEDSLSFSEASRSYSSKLLPLTPASLSVIAASSSASPSSLTSASESVMSSGAKSVEALLLARRSIFCRAANRFGLISRLPCWKDAVGH